MNLDRLSPLDATFLHVEDHVSHMSVGSVVIVDGPAPAYADLVALVAAKIERIPRYRQHVRIPALNLGAPVWADDPHFNLEYHVRHSALPPPGGHDELRHLMGRVMAQPLDRGRPLWEIWMVEGLAGGQWALVTKNHHALIDGVAGAELLGLILDLAPGPAPPGPPAPWRPEPSPSSVELAVAALARSLTSPVRRLGRGAGLSLPRPSLVPLARGLASLAGVARPTPPSSLNGPLGPHRRYAWTELGVDDVKRIRRAVGGSFNDVVLTLITRGFRDLLLSRGEPVDRVVRTLVPVSVRPRAESGLAVGDGRLANQVSAMFAELPVSIADPAGRLRAVSDQMAKVKESGQAVAAEALTRMAGFAPPMILALASRVATKAGQKNVNTVTTNVPGPQLPLYALGHRVRRIYPYVPIAGQVRVGVAAFSYDGLVTFGVTGDYDAAPDLDVLTAGIGAEAADLLALV